MAHAADGGSPPHAPPRADGPTLRFGLGSRGPGDAERVVLDTTWTPPLPAGTLDLEEAGATLSIRDVAESVLAEVDLIAETSGRLNAWARSSGIVDRLTIRGTSFWYYVRLRHWAWLQERILWALVADRIVTSRRPVTLVVGDDVADPLRDVLRLIARRDGLALVDVPEPAPVGDDAGAAPTSERDATTEAAPSADRHSGLVWSVKHLLVGIRNAIREPPPPPPPPWVQRRHVAQARAAVIRGHLDTLVEEPERRLLVVHEHARQRIDTPDGVLRINPYLDPIVERLRGSPLEPIRLDIRAQAGRDADWERIGEGRDPRLLTVDALVPAAADAASAPVADETPSSAGAPPDAEPADVAPPPWAGDLTGRIEVAGIDLGPLLAEAVGRDAARWVPNMTASIERIEAFLGRLRPRAILLADEYHRQDWAVAADALGIPVAAVEHGMIYPHHNGYIHEDRPASLRLPARTYVFGRYERALLVEQSVYRPDEVVVGGSPRLDLVRPRADDPAAIRAELGVRDDERMVVLSGTWGSIYRQVHYPIALAGLVDRELPHVHLVVKLHPGEPDDGPYRAIVESAAASRGIRPPPVTVARDVDLYRLLAAADAHLGIHSTVLTEAVVTRTPNLLSTRLAAADLLGYVEAGVAIPVRDGGDLLRALDAGRSIMAESDARAFVERHFEPGSAADRIAADLVGWLA